MGGGSGSTNTVSEGDKEYNARMATIFEAQQKIGEEYYQYWNDVYKPMETEQVAANRVLIPGQTELSLRELAADIDLLPSQTALSKAENEAGLQLLPGQTDLSLAEIAAKQQLLPGQTAASLKAQTMAMQGIDGNKAAREAASTVAGQFAGIEGATLRELSRKGLLDPNQAAVDLQSVGIERAKASAGAQTGARGQAQRDSFSMLTKVSG